MEERKKVNSKALIVITLFTVVVLGIAFTSAYFIITAGQNEQERVTISSGTLSLTFRDNDEIIKNIEETWNFGDTIEKELIIENTGTRDVYAKISWDNLINTYLAESLTYTLEEKTDEEGSIWTTVETESTNVPRSETASTVVLADHLFIPSGHTYTYRLRIKLEYLEGVEQSNDLEANFITKFTIAQGTKRLLANETLIAKANDVSITDYNSGVKGEMYTFDHGVANQTAGWSEAERRDYRYIGANPNNWVKFNDEDWRIIGVFTVESASGTKKQLIKIIRNESIGYIEWDSKGINKWQSSSLYTYLNSGNYYSTVLNAIAKGQIEEVKWYLGGSSEYQNLGGPNYYNFERGTTVYSGRSTNTIAKVGLIYPSDYVYTYANGVDNTCYTNGYDCLHPNVTMGWLYEIASPQWTISPEAGGSKRAFLVSDKVYSDENVGLPMQVNPTVYLASDIKIVSGDGASPETAYQLSEN